MPTMIKVWFRRRKRSESRMLMSECASPKTNLPPKRTRQSDLYKLKESKRRKNTIRQLSEISNLECTVFLCRLSCKLAESSSSILRKWFKSRRLNRQKTLFSGGSNRIKLDSLNSNRNEICSSIKNSGKSLSRYIWMKRNLKFSDL